jgi:hypothetical protein
MAKYQASKAPFVQARHVGPHQKPTAIVLSLSCTTSDKGSALGIATYHHKPSAPLKSWHYILDEAETYRCIPVSVAAYGNPYGAISVHICAQPHEYVPLWEDGSASKVMYRAADLVAELCLAYKIPARYLNEERWRKRRSRRRGGILVNVLGSWPSQSFLDDVQAQMTLKAKGA